jgi:hypothetical protein
MTKYLKAPITITGTVFVSEDEILDALGVESLSDVHPERIRVAFQDLANDKAHDMFPTDEPIKLQEIEIDVSDFSTQL